MPKDRPSGRIKEILDEVVANLRRHRGTTVTVSLEIEPEAPDGLDDHTERVVRENGNTLKLDGHSFEA